MVAREIGFGTRSLFKNSRAEWRLSHYAPRARMRLHSHDCAQFAITLSGNYLESTRDGEFEASGSSMELKPACFQHENIYGDHGALLLSLNLFAIDEDDRELTLSSWRTRSDEGGNDEWRLLVRELVAPEGPDESRVDDLTDDLLAYVLASVDGDRPLSSAPHWLLNVREALTEDDLGVETLAQDAGVHRVHLARMFRRYFGQSITEFRQQIRLTRGVDMLVRERVAPAQAACVAGYSDQAHFTRCLRRRTGLTPAILRKLFGSP